MEGQNLSVNRVLDVLIRRLRKDARGPNNAPLGRKEYYEAGFRAAVGRIEDYRRALQAAFPQLKAGNDE